MQCVFLDEFGHEGFYEAGSSNYHHSPVFGLGGIIIPDDNVPRLVGGFKNLKKFNFNSADREKKGKDVFTGKALSASVSLERRKRTSKIGYRLLNLISELGGGVVYSGLEKHLPQEKHDSVVLHKTCARRCVKLINDAFQGDDGRFIVIFDEHSNHKDKVQHLVSNIADQSDRIALIETPFQGDSELYNSIQAADWVCSLLGRVFAYMASPDTQQVNLPYYERFSPVIKKMSFRNSRVIFKAGAQGASRPPRNPLQPEFPFDPE